MNPVVIAVAITGSVPRKKDNPALPITPEEQVASTREAYEAGASLVHIHVRNDDESPSSDPERFAAVQKGIAEACPGMVIQFSTGGRGPRPEPARQRARPPPRHGLALDGLRQLPDHRLREPRDPRHGSRDPDEDASACGPRSRSSTCRTCTAPGAWSRLA